MKQLSAETIIGLNNLMRGIEMQNGYIDRTQKEIKELQKQLKDGKKKLLAMNKKLVIFNTQAAAELL